MIYKIFRFDKNTDYEAYYKPYEYERDFSTFCELLECIKEEDIYFDYDKSPQSFIVVNGRFVKQSSSPAIFNTDEIIIEPLDTRRSTKDLLMDKSDFYDHLEDFKGLIDENDALLYKQFDFLYYQSEMREFAPQFKGDSYLVFARKMLLKYPERTLELLQKVADQVYFHTTFKHTLTHNVNDYEEAIKKLKKTLFEANLAQELKNV